MILDSKDKALIIAAVIDVAKPDLAALLQTLKPTARDSLPEIADIIADICKAVIASCEKRIS